ncbi:MAG: flagellar motor switch protein FliN [Spirochaetes bacterium]|nr:flagellar motor switch protein FliN [Spirochaetota bacterium]
MKMGDQALSQDEIDALLQGSDEIFEDSSAASTFPGTIDSLSGDDLQKLRNLYLDVLDSQSNALTTLFQKDVIISSPVVELINKDSFMDRIPVPFLQINIPFTENIVGENIYIFLENDAIKIGSIMMGQDVAELTEMLISAVAEASSQLVGNTLTTFSNKYKTQIKTGSPSQIVVRNYSDAILPPDESFILISYNIKIDNYNSKFYQILSLNAAKGLVNMSSPSVSFTQPQPKMDRMQPSSSYQATTPSSQQFQTAQFSRLEPVLTPEEKKNISLILDVEMEVTVELGRTKKTIKEILSMGEGTIVELDRLAGEAVDLLVNGKKIAKGEVIVIEENFGLRITEILSKSERLNSLS